MADTKGLHAARDLLNYNVRTNFSTQDTVRTVQNGSSEKWLINKR